MAILTVPPEHLWPTGNTPPELRTAMHAQGQLTPEELNKLRQTAAEANGVENYRPPPRPMPDRQALEAERQTLRIVESPALAPQPQPILQRISANTHYHIPLSRQVTAEIVIHGEPTCNDFKLLLRYVKLMSSADFAVVAPPPTPVASLAEPPVRSIKRPRKQYAASA